jgi:hypothetical protein
MDLPQAWRQDELRCIQCYDPHSPQFKEMKSLAPPRYPPREMAAAAMPRRHTVSATPVARLCSREANSCSGEVGVAAK